MDGWKDERNWKMGIWYLIVRIVVIALAGAFVVAWHGKAWQGGNKSHLIIYYQLGNHIYFISDKNWNRNEPGMDRSELDLI